MQFCLVWTPIPVLTWILPFAGHMGICDSQGKIFDFSGHYTVNEGRMAFGSPTRSINLMQDTTSLILTIHLCGIKIWTTTHLFIVNKK